MAMTLEKNTCCGKLTTDMKTGETLMPSAETVNKMMAAMQLSGNNLSLAAKTKGIDGPSVA